MSFVNSLNIASNKFYSKQYISIFAPLKKSGRVASSSSYAKASVDTADRRFAPQHGGIAQLDRAPAF